MRGKYLIAAIASILTAFSAVSQSITICEDAGTSSISYYTATVRFPITAQSGTATWTLTGGTLVSYDNSALFTTGQATAAVQWDGHDPVKTITLYMRDNNGMVQTGTLNVTFYSANCYVYPMQQTYLLGQVPCLIKAKQVCIGTKNPPPQQYQWQQSDEDVVIWSDIPGATTQNYQPPALLSPGKVYRRKTTASSQTVYSDIATVFAAQLTPGELSTSSPSSIAYGQRPVIDATYAFGGICEPYGIQNYIWEQSVNRGPWQTIGTTSYYPTDAPVIRGSTRIRRRTIICTGEIVYTNILSFNVAYTSPNYENLNYVRENIVLTKGVYSWEHADDLPIGDKLQTTNYLDGLGRKIEQVEKESSFSAATNEWKDLVTPFEYDEAGRALRSYLPYPSTANPGKFKSGATAAQQSYYSTTLQDAYAYSETELDNSPENKVLKVFKPGAEWIGSQKYSSSVYDFNLQADAVQKWVINYSTTVPDNKGVYADYELYKNMVIDEKGNKRINYNDKFGNLILKKEQVDNVPGADHTGWRCTYYVYDDFNKLRFIITPKAVKYLETNGWNAVSAVANDLCYRYDYDSKGRMIVKQDPGSGEQHFVYDNRDRLVFAQDANQRSGYHTGSTQWSFILYDVYDNEIARGVANSTATRQQMQTAVDNLSNGIVSLSISTNTTETIKPFNPVVGNGYCPSCSNISYEVIQYFSVYDKSANMLDDIDYGFTVAYPLDDQMTGYDSRITNVRTGKKVKVLDGSASNYLSTTYYYNTNRRLLQEISWTFKGKMVSTNQYDFAGRLISSHNKLLESSYTYSLTNKLEFDKIGRLKVLSKKVNNDANYKKLSDYVYDEFGRIKTKRLGIDPISGGTQLESLDYKYNIHGLLTGLNQDFALKASGYTRWQHYFGMHIGYANGDGRFAKAEWNGNITGIIWNTQGDDEERKYDFYYDRTGQFADGQFRQYDPNSSSWSAAKIDFSNTVQYDLNGNFTTFMQKGVVPGKTPQTVDDLVYSYKNNSWSNQLQNIEEGSANTLGSLNGKLGEFKDDPVPGTASPDYDYDMNGNLVVDENKSIKNLYNGKGISYNHLNLVRQVKVDGQGDLLYTYDAEGRKLQTLFTPAVGSSVTTVYAHPYIFENNNLNLILTEEGRIRVITPYNNNNGVNLLQGNFQLPNGKWGVYDYFIKDHLQNTRVVLTEEVQSGGDVCTMETADPVEKLRQEKQFGQIDPLTLNPAANNEVVGSRRRVIQDATGWTTNPTVEVSKLDKNGYQIGPNVILKVMAGDVIRAEARYYYASDPGPATGTAIVNQLLSAFLGAYATAGSPGLKGTSADLTTNLFSPLSSFAVQQVSQGPNPNAPQAYLNYIFFDERMNVVDEASSSQRVSASGDTYDHWVRATDIKAPKNGFVYVYLSNESVQPVYFDDFAVTHVRGRIVEENHYYPFGLKMQGISSKKLGDANNGTLQNRYAYQGSYSEENGFVGWNEFQLRNYDPQVGRWISADPITQFASPYLGMGNNPISGVDPNGGFRTQFGAWLWNFFNGWGGGDIVYNGSQWTVNFPVPGGVETVFRNPSAEYRRRRARAEQFSEYMIQERYRYEVAHNIGRGQYSGPVPHMGPDGHAVWGGEKGLETPAIDPIDLGVGLAKGLITVAARKATEAAVRSATVTMARGATTGVAESVEISTFKALDNVLLDQGVVAEMTGSVEVIGNYTLHGTTKSMVGTTFNRNIFYITTEQELKSIKALRGLLTSFEEEALRNGADKLSIYGSSVINMELFNPNIASRFGYTVEKLSSGGVILEKVLR